MKLPDGDAGEPLLRRPGDGRRPAAGRIGVTDNGQVDGAGEVPVLPRRGRLRHAAEGAGLGRRQVHGRLEGQQAGRRHAAGAGPSRHSVRFEPFLPDHATDGCLRADVRLPDKAATLDQLGDAMTKVLTEQGLYDKEARAMVKTWRSAWFGEEGTRSAVHPAARRDRRVAADCGSSRSRRRWCASWSAGTTC